MNRTPSPGAGRSSAWVLRPILWFAVAYTINVIVHESSHAWTAYALGVQATLFNFSVDLSRSHAGLEERAWVAIAGPVVSFLFGMSCWLVYRRARDSAAGLPLIYLSAFGLGMFFGNLVSAAFVGDFSVAAAALGMPVVARYAATAMGAVSLLVVLFCVGRELRQWVPEGIGTVMAAVGIIALPVLVGTAAVILVNQPAPASFAAARGAEASLWVAAGIGALIARRSSRRPGRLEMRSIDAVLAILVALLVRLMARGISFAP